MGIVLYDASRLIIGEAKKIVPLKIAKPQKRS